MELEYLGGKNQELPTLRSLAIDLLNETKTHCFLSEEKELDKNYLTSINDPEHEKEDLYNLISDLENDLLFYKEREEQPQLEYHNAYFN